MTIDVASIVTSSGALTTAAGPLSDAWGLILGDRVAAWRLTNAARLQSKVQANLAKLGLKQDRGRVPERYAITWFEEATKQDEAAVQDLFANLLARAAAGEKEALDRRHCEILTHMTPEDVETFEWFFATFGVERYPNFDEFGISFHLRQRFGDDEKWSSIEHLLVLGVFERRFDVVEQDQSAIPGSYSAHAEIQATSRGMALYHACRPIADVYEPD